MFARSVRHQKRRVQELSIGEGALIGLVSGFVHAVEGVREPRR